MTIPAVWLGKLVAWLCRATHRGGGTTLPGSVALRLCPDLHCRLAGTVPRGVILVTGTNGKTTTAKMLTAILRAAGLRVARNVAGANLRGGIASALLAASDLRGRVPADIAVLEVDEGAAPNEIRALQPRLVVLTNLFRDQLDRYGELATTARRLAGALADGLGADATLVANADDPLVVDAAGSFGGRTVTFGLDCAQRGLSTADHASDSDECERCGHALDYTTRFGAHIGTWRCPACGCARPEPDVAVTQATLRPDLAEEIELAAREGVTLRVTLRLPGLYNVANAAAAAAAALALGVQSGIVERGLGDVTPAFGRLETVAFEGDRTAHLMLVKNPAGLNEVARLIASVGEPRPTVIALNDNTADGHDVSWIWDADLEALREMARPVVASGVRAYDMALRLKYAHIPEGDIEIVADTREALSRALERTPAGGHLYVLPTYTAMLDLRGRLQSEGRVAAFWEEIG